jgi:phosphoglycerate dehydrogenase-like enzyme
MTVPRPVPAAPLHVAVTLDFPASFLERVRSVDERVVVHHHPVEGREEELPAPVLAAAEVLYTSGVLPGPGAAPALRWVQLDTSGVDHLRGSALWDSDVVVTTLAGVSPAPLAEWVLMMVLAHAHHLRDTEALAARRHWPSPEDRWKLLMPRDLRRATVGIVGYGSIGQEVARLCQAFGMRVLAVRRDPGSPVGERFGRQPELPDVAATGPGGLRDLLAQSDYVVLTVPLTAETEGMIGERELEAMKPGAVLVNAGRGGVVDETALVPALDRGQLDRYASDVFATEPLPADDPLWSHPRAVVTPHIAGFAPDYLEVVGTLFTENLRRYLDGAPLLNLADRGRGY